MKEPEKVPSNPILTVREGSEEGSELSNAQEIKPKNQIRSGRRTVYEACRKQGHSIKVSAELAGYNYSYARQMEMKRKEGVLSACVYDSEKSFLGELLPIAKRTMRKMMQGKMVGQLKPTKRGMQQAARLMQEIKALEKVAYEQVSEEEAEQSS